FGAVTIVSGKENGAESVEDYKGLYQQKPWFAVFFTVMLLALAGVPLTSGFIADFYLLQAGAGSELWLLMFSLIASAVIGLFYYLRVVIAIFSRKESPGLFYEKISFSTGFAFTILLVLLLWLAVYPTNLLNIIGKMM
ncbi:MAG: proton-conducting transporter membrane subunit, partial [Ginsengibacter sp.]